MLVTTTGCWSGVSLGNAFEAWMSVVDSLPGTAMSGRPEGSILITSSSREGLGSVDEESGALGLETFLGGLAMTVVPMSNLVSIQVKKWI